MNHTQEPWWACCTGEGSYSHFIFDRNERAICSLCSNDPDDKRDKYSSLEEILIVPERQANAERIVACVNFCEGIETEELNDSKLKKLWGESYRKHNSLLKKLSISICKNIHYSQWFDELVISALYKGEQFLKDHGRPMTFEEKRSWMEEKKAILTGRK